MDCQLSEWNPWSSCTRSRLQCLLQPSCKVLPKFRGPGTFCFTCTLDGSTEKPGDQELCWRFADTKAERRCLLASRVLGPPEIRRPTQIGPVARLPLSEVYVPREYASSLLELGWAAVSILGRKQTVAVLPYQLRGKRLKVLAELSVTRRSWG